MSTVAHWLAAPLVHIEAQERSAFAAALAEAQDAPSACDCGALAMCRRHRIEFERVNAPA